MRVLYLILEEYLARMFPSFFQRSTLVYLIPVLMVGLVMRFHQASSVTAHQGGVDQHVLLVGMPLLMADLLGWKILKKQKQTTNNHALWVWNLKVVILLYLAFNSFILGN